MPRLHDRREIGKANVVFRTTDTANSDNWTPEGDDPFLLRHDAALKLDPRRLLLATLSELGEVDAHLECAAEDVRGLI